MFKKWIDKASPANLMAYLFQRDSIRQSCRLGLFGAWDHLPSTSLLQEVISKCPNLHQSYTMFDEDSTMSPFSIQFHNKLDTHQVGQSEKIEIPYTDRMMAEKPLFIQKLIQSYQSDYYHISPPDDLLCSNRLVLFSKLAFADR